MDEAQEWARIIGSMIAAVGGFKGLELITKALHRRFTGQDKRDELQDALRFGDSEARKRRVYAETLHETRLVAREHGVPLEVLPPWPRFGPHTGPTDLEKKE